MNKHIIEKDWTAHGLRCVVIGIPNLHRCGYVAVGKEHPLYGVDYGNESAALNGASPECYFGVHGGVTYAGGKGDHPVESPDLWWYGFDCAHMGDSPDPALRDADYRDFGVGNEFGHVWTAREVAAECESLAEQLAQILAHHLLAENGQKG